MCFMTSSFIVNHSLHNYASEMLVKLQQSNFHESETFKYEIYK